MAELAMFPLGTVLFPSLVLPLHVFEPRYQALVRDCLAGSAEFGVVLIERGREVGGGEVRTTVGTVAHILEAARIDDERWALAALGTRRIRVRSWLDDDPYPRADVEDWDDTTGAAGVGLGGAYAAVTAAFRRVGGLRSELGEPAPPATLELAEDPAVGSHQLAALGPFGPADQQRLLEAADPTERLGLLSAMLAEETDVLERRLALG
jgi:uncharacterized protein